MHQSTLHKHMEVVMNPEVTTTATEGTKETITINTEVDTKATKAPGNLSIWMTEEIIFGTLMETQLTPPKSKMQLLPFILQAWKVTENMTEDKDPIEDQEEDMTEDKDPTEDQGEDQTEDMDLAEEEEEEHNMVPETKLQIMEL